MESFTTKLFPRQNQGSAAQFYAAACSTWPPCMEVAACAEAWQGGCKNFGLGTTQAHATLIGATEE